MDQVMAYMLDNQGNRILDESGSPIVKVFDGYLWDNIQKFKEPKWEFIKVVSQSPKADTGNVKVTKIEPKKVETKKAEKPTEPKEEKDFSYLSEMSVKVIRESLDKLTDAEIDYILKNDKRKSAIEVVKKYMEK